MVVEKTLQLLSLNDQARIWIYVADRNLTDIEVEEIRITSQNFVRDWAAHGKPLTADAEVLWNRVLVLAVDEAQMQASGCSIDTSVHFVQELGKRYHVDFFNRMQLWIQGENGWKSIKLQELAGNVRSGEVKRSDVLFDTTVANLGQLRNGGLKPLEQAWCANYLN